MTKRATFATRLGVIAATAGSSVGLGNIWRFPYETGQNGGAAFLLVYCICVIVLGLPVMLAEFTIGRSAKANATRTFMKLSPGSYWFIVGFLGIFAAVFIMGFYSVIAGWTLEYVWQSISFGLTGKDPAFFQSAFVEFTSSSFRPIFWTALFLLINYIILSRGVHNGIEKASNILMPLLFVLLIIFGIRSLFLSGTAEGLSFMFHPDFSKIDSGVVLRAMGQAFFSLSLGMGTLITYSSYFSENTSLPKTAVTVASLDTVVAVLAGIVIFPAVFSFGISPSQGPELIFITLPNVFQHMPGAYFWSILFFILITVAALTSTISLCEVAIAFLCEEFGFIRSRATQLLVFICFVMSILCSLSFGALSDVKIFGFTIFDFCDFLASNILLPLGGMLISIYVGWKLDRKFVRNELNNHGKINDWYFPALMICLKYIAPVAIFIIFLSGLGLFK
ncbi:sodium-dependent transporter [Coprobacter tertius]|uniref:Transporter n=1 Tax=Coprobacter tertius TaxID=2944915 RepID=A0ABT1MML8_9BACT|nr:sodium-dependent transporter [Coprobacter tertius]MCP9612998.1 sodium-dependent transporter [Coprobacter tertius]